MNADTSPDQSVKATMPTAHKRAWIAALHGAGLRELGYDDAAIAGLSKAHIIGGHPA